MNDHFSTLSEVLARTQATPTAGGVWTLLKELGARYGYSFLMAAEVPSMGRPIQDTVIYSDMRGQFPADHARPISSTMHPCIRYAATAHAPFTVREVSALEAFRDTDWAAYLPPLILAGEGLIVPVRRGQDIMGGMVFGGEKPDISPLVRAILQVASHAAVLRVDGLKNQTVPLPAPALSAREIQCLTHIASGHEDEQISQMLGISPRTVRFHVDSAKVKLGVNSRVQAVTKALRDRLITV